MKFGEEEFVIGIVGFGFVGKALQHGFAQTTDFRIYDTQPRESINTFEEVVTESDFIFVCVPTPMDLENGRIDLSIVESVVDDAAPFVEGSDRILVIKTTVVPGTCQWLHDKHPHVRIAHNPEFLTERSYRLDFINQSRIVLGGEREDTDRLERLYRLRFPTTPICHTDWTTAEMVKYASNCFFAAKVSVCNEFYDICQALGISYQEVMEMVMLDGRIGNSHWMVPGHDGDRGYGGKCFPKDMNALINRCKELGIDPIMLEAAWEKNMQIRQNHDWLNIKGAVSKKEEK